MILTVIPMLVRCTVACGYCTTGQRLLEAIVQCMYRGDAGWLLNDAAVIADSAGPAWSSVTSRGVLSLLEESMSATVVVECVHRHLTED